MQEFSIDQDNFLSQLDNQSNQTKKQFVNIYFANNSSKLPESD